MQADLLKRKLHFKYGKSGFTLLELLIVVFIVGILLAILIPAISAIRESSRRAGCRNNLKQIGVALHSFHELHRSFPAASVNEWSWSATILPHSEENDLYLRFDFNVEPFLAPNRKHTDLLIRWLICPSDAQGDFIQDEQSLGMRFAHTNYIGSLAHSNHKDRGMFGFNRGVRIAQVTDGTSKTIFVGERGIVRDGDSTHGWWVWGSETTVSADQVFMRGDYEDESSALHWWSNHTDGANFLMVDGSQRFLPYMIDHNVFLSLGTKDGQEVIENF